MGINGEESTDPDYEESYEGAARRAEEASTRLQLVTDLVVAFTASWADVVASPVVGEGCLRGLCVCCDRARSSIDGLKESLEAVGVDTTAKTVTPPSVWTENEYHTAIESVCSLAKTMTDEDAVRFAVELTDELYDLRKKAEACIEARRSR